MEIPVYGGKSSSIVNIVLPIRNDVAISSTCDKESVLSLLRFSKLKWKLFKTDLKYRMFSIDFTNHAEKINQPWQMETANQFVPT